MKWKRIVAESEQEECLTVHTGLMGKKSLEILDSVIGQMSDGMWENSPVMEHYWRFITVEFDNGEVVLKIEKRGEWEQGSRPGNMHFVDNYFMSKLGGKDAAILAFMGKKVKAVAKENLKDDGEGNWDRNDTSLLEYLYSNEDVTTQNAYFVYEKLIGRTGFEKKYPEEVVNEMLY